MSFRHKSSLSRHRRIHLKVTQCGYCNRTFRYESFLKKHVLTAHKGLDVDEGMRTIKIEPEHVTEVHQVPQVIEVDSTSHSYAQTFIISCIEEQV